MSEVLLAHPRCRAQLLDQVVAATAMPLETVRWIADAIRFTGAFRRLGSDTGHVDADELCRMLVADIDARSAQDIRITLERLGIASSRDIGSVVYALIDVDLCRQSDADTREDFDGVFETADIESYLRRSGIDRLRDMPMRLKSAFVGMCCLAGVGVWVGCILVRGGSAPAGLGGALVGVGWVVSRLPYPKPMRFGWPWSTRVRREHRGNDPDTG